MVTAVTSAEPEARMNKVDRHCSFCGKNEQCVRKLIRGPNVCICDERVELDRCREESDSFYLRSPAEYRKLAEQTTRRYLDTRQTWLRLAQEAEARQSG
jgi:hypothetical protein